VTDPEHERPFGEAILPGGTEAFCLWPEAFGAGPTDQKIYVRISAASGNLRFSEFWTFDCTFAAP
jgi:hypothetical protein